MSHYDACCFDLDGTLVDSRVDIAVSCNAVRESFDLQPLSVDRIVACVGDGMEALLQRVFDDAPKIAMPEVRQRFVAHYGEHCCDATACYPGVEDLLAQLHAQGLPMAVISNKPLAFTRSILDGLHLTPYFPVAIGGDQAKKPDPAAIRLACEQLAVDPLRVLMVGDHHTDLGAGRAAGSAVVFCRWGIGQADAEPRCADIDEPAQLLPILGLAPA